MKLQLFLAARKFNRPALEILADLIWISTGYRPSLHHTTFGKPRKLDQRPDIADDANSYIPAEIDEAFDASFPGENGFAYYRMPIGLLTEATPVVVSWAYPFNTHDVLAQINTQLDCQLTATDVMNTRYNSGAEVFELRAAPHSLIWCNEEIAEFPPIDLALFSPLILNGLVYVQPA